MIYRNDDKKASNDAEEDDGSKSGLIDKALLPKGTKVGDSVLFKITHGFDGEFEIKYAHAGKDKGEGPQEGPQESPQEEAPDADLEDLVADA